MENTWIFKHEHGKELLFKKEVQKTQNKASKIFQKKTQDIFSPIQKYVVLLLPQKF